MQDEETNSPSANNDPKPASAGGSSPDQGGSSPDNSSSDPIKMAEEVGRLKKVEEDYKRYLSQTDPVIQTIWSDQELLNKVTETHNKRLGITPKDPEPSIDSQNPAPSPAPTKDPDTRNWAIKQVVESFHNKHGVDKLTEEQKAEIDQKVAVVLRETLNPTGGKTLAQIMEDVPLDALPSHLDKAYYWATRNEREAQLKEQGRKEALQEDAAFIGSMASTAGGSGDGTTLTPKEREVARKMGIPEDKYLANKKEMLQRNNQLY